MGLFAAFVYPCALVYVLLLVPLAGAPVDGVRASILLMSVLAVASAYRAGSTPGLDPRSGRAWKLFVAGNAFMIVSTVLAAVLPHNDEFPHPPTTAASGP